MVAFRLKGNANGDAWKDIIVVLNASKKVQTITVPRSSYTSVCEGGMINLSGISHINDCHQLTVSPQEALIVHN